MIKNPLISVLCSSFNHEKYVGYFINSLLKQTYTNWELIIIDDCSTDGNVREIKKFTDERIHFYEQEFNGGQGVVTPRAFSLSKGEIIVDLASDDAIREDYFARIVEVFSQKENVGVIYSSLQIIDYENNPNGNWDLPDLDRIGLLNHMFYKGNCLFSPGFAIRRNFYKLLLPFNFAIIQHQDYQWHIKLLLNTDCELLKDYYVYYRFQNEESVSLSGMNIGGENRYRLEEEYLMNTFLQINDARLAELILGLQENQIKDKNLIPYFLATEILKSDNLEKRQWGYKTLINFFDDPENLSKLHEYNNFQFKDLLEISKNNYYDLTSINDKLSAYEKFIYAPFFNQVKMCIRFLLKRIIKKLHYR
ncbi:MAG: glycosyltransferase family A protein [Spirochaetales bacterium]|nr:glycosyltransferase family A protein [Spirochaetales bacterium]